MKPRDLSFQDTVYNWVTLKECYERDGRSRRMSVENICSLLHPLTFWMIYFTKIALKFRL